MNVTKSTIAVLFATAAAAGLSGCFGGGDDDEPAAPPAPTAQVPVSASQSTAGMVAYLKALIAAPGADVLEPVDATSFNPPTSDTTEPESVS